MAMKVSHHIEAPVETVFDYFKDPASDTGLGYELVESRTTKEGVGTYLSWRIRIAGVPVYSGMEVITDLVPNEHITEKSSRALVGTWEYSFESEGNGTKLTMEHRPRSFWAWPLLSNLVDAATTRMNETYIRRVRGELEAQPDVPGQRQAPSAGAKKPPAAV